jgi:single-strand DNA-binding protein
MAASRNLVILIGNLGADPETRYTSNGKAVTNFRIATTERYNDRDGNTQERTEWHRIVVWGKQAEACNTFLRKGSQVYVEGKIQTREYDKDGSKRYITEVTADSVVFLGGKGDAQAPAQGGRRQEQAPAPQRAASQVDEDEEDVPF